MRKFNIRIIAVLLLLVLSQNLGLRLLLHNKFHKSISYELSSKSTKGALQMHCDCMDEALIPFTPASTVEIVVPEKAVMAFEKSYRVYLATTTKIFRSLRAPPAA